MRALTVAVLGLGVRSLAFATDANAVVHLYSAPDASGAVQMCTVNDEIWFPQPNSDSLARINDDGSLTRRNVPTSGSRPLAISREDGNGRLVFTEVGTNRIGIFDANGALTEYDVPTPASNPRGITSPNLVWFTEYDGNRIGRFQAGSPGSMVEFAIPTFASGPLGIAPGPGGSEMWFTENLANKIGRIDASGAITEFDIPTPDSGPIAIVRGFDGSQELMYFTEARGNMIGSIAITGQVTERAIPTPNSSPTDLVFDNVEQAVWFTERNAGKLGWMSIDGDFHEFPLPGTSKPESLVIDYGQFFFGPMSIWYVDATNRRVGKLSDNHLFALGARHEGTLDTEFELSNSGNDAVKARLGWPYTGPCPAPCIVPTSIELVVPRRGEVEATASEVPSAEGQRFFYVTGIEPEISDVPETRAWVVDEDRPETRIEVPLISYWTIATLQPPLARGSNGPQPFLTFPARRQTGFQTTLVLAAIETEDGGPLELEIDVLNSGGDVVASTEVAVPLAGVLVLDQLLSDLDIFGDFDGRIRVKRIPRSGLFWGVVETYESNVLTRLMPPGSELEPPSQCVGGPARCNPRRTPRVVVREAP